PQGLGLLFGLLGVLGESRRIRDGGPAVDQADFAVPPVAGDETGRASGGDRRRAPVAARRRGSADRGPRARRDDGARGGVLASNRKVGSGFRIFPMLSL